MRQALQGLPCQGGGTTVAEGIGVKAPGQLTLPIVRKLVEDILLVEEREIEHSVQLLLEVEKTVVEGAGAVGLAMLLKDSSDRFKHKRVGVVLSGGNIDLTVLASVIQRGLVRSGRLVRLRAELPDRPGALAEITKVLSELDANIVEIIHHRSFTNVPLKSAEVEIVVETRGTDHLSHVVLALQSTPFTISLPNQPNP